MKIINHRKFCTYHVKDILYLNNCKKILIKFSVYLVFFSVAILIALIPNILSSEKHKAIKHRHTRFTTDLKYILFWKQPKKNKKNFYNKDIEYLPGQTQFIKQNCPYINCYITYNQSLLRVEEDFDAIVFNIHDIKKLNVHNINLGRSPHQKYIFKSFESGEKHPVCNSLFDDFFNLTWTYKLDSDVPQPFINIYDKGNNLVGPDMSVNWSKDMAHTDKYENNIRNKSKAVALIVTNCKIKNKYQGFLSDLGNELKGYNYSLDILGPCSEKKCPKGGIVKCFKLVEQKYYFNLVLEDSFGEDYVTEKMSKAMNYLSVPIVNGLANYSRFLPPGSYINAHSFDIKTLVAILDYLIINPKKYSYFFDWTNYYYFSVRPRSYVCDLCTKLNENSKVQKYYTDLRSWWYPDFDDTCQRVHLYNLFRDTP